MYGANECSGAMAGASIRLKADDQWVSVMCRSIQIGNRSSVEAELTGCRLGIDLIYKKIACMF